MLAEAWLRDAMEEHASVAAFARFSLGLLAQGAPPELVSASQRASLDEIKHARDCLMLAARYGAPPDGPGEFDLTGALEVPSLEELCLLCIEEGAVGETLGALLAAEQHAGAEDPTARGVCRRIAKDEAHHAELAWRFLSWALPRGGDWLRVAARGAFEAACASAENGKLVDYRVNRKAWRAHGRLTCEEARAVARRGIDEVIRPGADALLETPPATPNPVLRGHSSA